QGLAEERAEHALALDAAAEYRRVVRSAEDGREPAQVEAVSAWTGALRAGRARFSHCRPSPHSRSRRSGRWLPAPTRWRSSRTAAPGRAPAPPPHRRKPRGWRGLPWLEGNRELAS